MERRISLGLGLLLALWFQPPLLQPLVVYAVRQAQQPGLALVNTTSPEEARPEARPLPEDGTRNLLRSPQLPWQEVLAEWLRRRDWLGSAGGDSGLQPSD